MKSQVSHAGPRTIYLHIVADRSRAGDVYVIVTRTCNLISFNLRKTSHQFWGCPSPQLVSGGQGGMLHTASSCHGATYEPLFHSNLF